jgi:four helix bundle protein
MGARTYDELDCWQLANELKVRVYAQVNATPARRDLDFANQIRASASSAPANISEGFAFYRHREFAQRVRVARAELTETHNHLRDGVNRGHWTAEQAAPLIALAERALKASAGLLRHLSKTDPPPGWENDLPE